MPSLFSRSRTASTPKRPALESAFDEFGRIASRGSTKTLKVGSATLSPVKKDKKNKDKSRARTISTPVEPEPSEFTLPDGSFLHLNLDPPKYEPGEEPPQEHRQLIDYGYLSYQRHVVLGLGEVARLVDIVGDELGTRGLTTPFIFSTLALDVSCSAVKRLIQAFLRTCGRPSHEADRLWREEARFAGPHELGMCLRWGLARIVRIVGGQEVRGIVSYDQYQDWRDAEAALNYPETHFGAFLAHIQPVLQSILVGLFALLVRLTAHSSSSGHTPPTLSPLFGPLLFGLGPSTLAFHHVYVHYLRAATAAEHLMLSFIRWQDAPGRGSSSATSLGVPTRLKAWIQGYPSMLPVMKKNERPQPRRGARTIRLVSVRRNVRMYSPDLVKTAASWGQRPHGPTSSAGDRSFAGSKEWERIAPPTLKLTPRYSDAYKKRMGLASNFHPELGPGSTSSTLSAPSLSASISTASTTSSFLDDKELGMLGKNPNEDRFRSLTDLKWGEFETMGFGGLGTDEKKLQFDLTESARASRSAKRSTLSWQDFSAAGFSRTDAPLSATLQFSPPVANSINAWPSQSAEIHRKLKKTQKALPPFGWDTEPIMGGEEVIEEAFVDVFCDLVYGGGWMDAERAEDVDRDCNWALIEFKSLPVARTMISGADPRNSTTLILFEEFVPLEYRQQLADSGASRRRLPSLFSTSKKQWKPAPTLNGRPYVIGHVPRSPSYREVEFEGLLRSNGSATKIISLKPAERPERQQSLQNTMSSPVSTIGAKAPSPVPSVSRPQLFLTPSRSQTPVKRPSSRQSDIESPTVAASSSTISNKITSRFRLPVSPIGGRTAGLPPSEYDTVDFEARLASFDDDDLLTTSATTTRSKHGRRQSKDDAWVDILVASNSRRLGAQDADMRNGLKSGRSDPELASQEVSEVLAAVRQVVSDDESEDELEPVHGLEEEDRHRDDSTVAESEADRDTIPGRSELTYMADDTQAEEEEEEVPPVVTPSKRRLGYFDLHPERRTPNTQDDDGPNEPPEPGNLQQPAFDDARAHFERNSMYEDPRSAFERPSLDSQTDSIDYEPRDVTEAPASTPPPPAPKVIPDSVPSVSSPIPPIPSVDITPPPKDISEPSTSKPTQSKTASLIEMYRERERGNSPSPAPLTPSKLPVRTGASLPPHPRLGERSVSPLPTRSISPSPSPPQPIPPELDDSLREPPQSGSDHDDIDLMTPSRYIHGAPLHNVIEEEEEEEE